jgi:hypothetical protein
MRLFILILGLFSSIAAHSTDDFKSYFLAQKNTELPKSVFTKSNFFVGHSLSQTSYTLPKGRWMAGTFALGYGVTNNLTVGTSPWLLTLYNMPNILIRSKIELSTSSAVGVHVGYMKTAEYFRNEYEMELLYGNLIYSFVVNKSVRTHFQGNLMNFFNETRPFSIRVSRPKLATQISFSNITELVAYRNKNHEIGFGAEIGYLGVNESRPYLHGGLSIYRKTKDLFIQAGLSLSASNNVGVSDFSYLSRGNLPPGGEFREILTHPEIQVQYYF